MTTAKLSCATTKFAILGEQPVSRLPVEAFVATRAQNFAVERQARLVPDAIFKVKFGDGPARVEAALLEASQDAVERFQGRELGASPGPLLGLPQKIQASELTGLAAPQVRSETTILPRRNRDRQK